MCTLMTTAEMPTKASGENKNKSYIAWFPKPNKDGENTRVRLLWFLAKNKSDRKTPYFTQMVHDHWGESPNGGKIVDDTVVCPLTRDSKYDDEKWLTNDKTGKKYINCPICQKEKEAMAVWKNSGWKDKAAMRRHFALAPKFRAYVPVYIISDPNNHKNDGKLKVMILTNKEDFDLFDQVVRAEKAKAYLSSQNGNPYEIFNGKNGVDLYLHCETVEEMKKNGYLQRVRKMTGIAFDDPTNKYDIGEINKDAIDAFDMDETYFISNTKQDLEDFYRRYYGKDETVIPKENVDIFKKMKMNSESVKTSEPIKMENSSIEDVNMEVPPEDIHQINNIDDIIQNHPEGTPQIEKQEMKSADLDEYDASPMFDEIDGL